MNVNRFTLIILFLLPKLIVAQDDKFEYRLNGFIDSYHAVRSQTPYDFLSSRTRLRTEIFAQRANTNMFVSINATHNSIIQNKTGFALREAFFRYTTNNCDIKIGRQIINWGIADGLRLTDIVSPMDYTEFLAQDYDDIRIPVNAFRLKLTQQKFNAEFIFIPVSDFFILPLDSDNPWSVLSSLNIPYIINDTKPKTNLRNSEIGGRLSFFLNAIDFSISALHSWNKMPIMKKSFSDTSDSLFIQTQYARMDMAGADCSLPIGKFVIRTEIALFLNELQDCNSTTDNNLNQKKHSFSSLFGIDFYPGNDWNISLQYSHKNIIHHNKHITSPRNSGLATLNVSKKLIQNTLTLSSFTYYDVTYNSFFNRSNVAYSLNDQMSLTIGYDWFNGNKGSFAVYQHNSEYWIKAKFNF